MKTFLSKILLFVLLLTGALTLPVFTRPQETGTLLDIAKVKRARIKSRSEPAVVFIAGSNLSMGLDSSIIAERLKMPVLDMGIHAGLGLCYELQSIRRHLIPGDVVVVAPEYSSFSGGNCLGNLETVSMVSDILPEDRELLTAAQWLHLLPFIPQYGALKARRILMNAVKRLLGKKRPPVSGGFNEFGDSVAHWGKPGKPFPAVKKMGAADFNPRVLTFLRRFRESLPPGVGLVLIPPVFQKSSFLRQEEYIRAAERALREHGMGFLSPPRRYALDDSYFYDTPYHLTYPGVLIRTRMVADDLEKLGLLKKAPRAGTQPGGAAAPAPGPSSIHDVRHPTSDVGGARSDIQRPT